MEAEGTISTNKRDVGEVAEVSEQLQRNYLKNIGIELGKIIGKGTYSKVREAVQGGSHRMAAKVMSRRSASREFVDHFLPREMEVMRKIGHPNIVKVYRIIDFHDDVYIFMELCEAGDLHELIDTHGQLPEEEARVIFLQLLEAVDYLHQRGIYHRDIKCENVLLHSDGSVRLTDLGFCRNDMSPGDLSTTYCGSAYYASPEVLKGQPYLPRRHDIWSLGVVLFVMVTGRFPFESAHIGRTIADKASGVVRFPSQKNRISQQGQDLIRRMLEQDQTRRATLKQIKEHPWTRDRNSTAN